MSFITQVLIPRFDNLGTPFHESKFVRFHARMIRKFRGWTRKGIAEGAWLSLSDHLFTDEHWVYEIGHTKRELGFWRREKERLKAEFDQEDIWIIQYEGRQI